MHPRLLRSETDSLIFCESLYFEVVIEHEAEAGSGGNVGASFAHVASISGHSLGLKFEPVCKMVVVVSSCKHTIKVGACPICVAQRVCASSG